MKYLVFGALALAACQQAASDPVSAPQGVSVPADWCVSTGPDGRALILTETRIIPAGEVTPAQLAATPSCAPVAPAEPL